MTESGEFEVIIEKKRHRWIENSLAILGALLIAFYVFGVEIFPHIIYSTGKCTVPPNDNHGIPWGIVLSALVLILPKVVSRATYGRIWDSVANRILKTRSPDV